MSGILATLLSAVFLLGAAPVQAADYILPVKGSNFRVTQEPGGSFSHNKPATIYAWDLAGSGVPVAVADGVVYKVSFNARGYGNYVVIKYADGVSSLYGHLARASVSVGQNVSQGQQIGVIDSTGKSTGNHLHFSFFKNGRPISASGLLSFSNLRGNFVTRTFDVIFPKVGGAAPIPVAPGDIIKPISDMAVKFYKYALDIGAVVALGVITWGGILYISSAGNPSKQGEAKEWIKAAIYGLILLLLSYLLLSTTNPCLVGVGSGCT